MPAFTYVLDDPRSLSESQSQGQTTSYVPLSLVTDAEKEKNLGNVEPISADSVENFYSTVQKLHSL